MKKRFYTIILTLLLSFQFTVSANSVPVSSTNTLSLKELEQLFEEHNVVDQEIELKNSIDRKTYTDILDEYTEMEEVIQQLNDQIKVLQIQIDQTISEAEKADKFDTINIEMPADMLPPGSPLDQKVNAKDYYLNKQLPGLMNAKTQLESMYKDMVKMQLNSYAQMELLKLQLDFSDKDKEQKHIKSKNEFIELCYNYYLASLEKELILKEKEIVQNNINNLKEQQLLGLTTQTEIYLKENQLQELKEKEVYIINQEQEYYQMIIRTLNIETDIKIAIDIIVPEVNKVMDYNTFYNTIRNQSFTINMIEEQVNIYNHQKELAYIAYNKNDKELEKIILDIEKNELKNIQLQQQMNALIPQIYKSFLVAQKQYEVAKESYDISTKEFENSESKLKLGQISDYEFQEAAFKFNKAYYEYEKSKVEFIFAYHTFEEAIAGILEV